MALKLVLSLTIVVLTTVVRSHAGMSESENAKELLQLDCSPQSTRCRTIDSKCLRNYCVGEGRESAPPSQCFFPHIIYLGFDEANQLNHSVFYDIDGSLYMYPADGLTKYLERVSSVWVEYNDEGLVVDRHVHRTFTGTHMFLEILKVLRRTADPKKLREIRDKIKYHLQKVATKSTKRPAVAVFQTTDKPISATTSDLFEDYSTTEMPEWTTSDSFRQSHFQQARKNENVHDTEASTSKWFEGTNSPMTFTTSDQFYDYSTTAKPEGKTFLPNFLVPSPHKVRREKHIYDIPSCLPTCNSDSQKIPHLYRCDSYFTCTNLTPALMTCGPNMEFKDATQNCVPRTKSDADCFLSASELCLS